MSAAVGRVAGNWPLALVVIGLLGGAATFLNAFNSTLIFDDPFLYEHFEKSLSELGVLNTLGLIFFSLDLHVGVPEYRTYGLSKVIHFLLWLIFDERAWMYSALIGLLQTGSALLLYRLLVRASQNHLQAFLVSIVWILSPFLVTTCFHHYSYLIFPVQITLAIAFVFQGLILENHRLRWSSKAGLALAGASVVLTGELHFILAAVMLLLVVHSTPSSLKRMERWAYLVWLGVPAVLVLLVHYSVWNSWGGVAEFQRFNYSSPSFIDLFERSADYFFSIPRGASAQVGHILKYSRGSVLTFLSLAMFVIVLLVRLGKKLDSGGKRETSGVERTERVFMTLLILFAASLAVNWIHSVLFNQVGEVLPRRYGYVPYTLFFMALIALLTATPVRKRMGEVPAFAVTGFVVALWGALQFVCLPQVRSQDSGVWDQLRFASIGKKNPHVLFVNALNAKRPTGFDSPGIRGSAFPPIFESPFMRNGWQVQYARKALGFVAAGDSFELGPSGSESVSLSGQLNGIHFLQAPPVMVPEESIVVVMDAGVASPDWKDNLQRVQVVKSWPEFKDTPAFARVKIEAGWGGLLAGIFNDDLIEVALDLGQKAPSRIPGVMPDKKYGEYVVANPVIADYGLESGDDGVYAPNGKSGAPLSYLTTNRHGVFTYRIDFADAGQKDLSIDFLDWWADRPGVRVMNLQVAFDDRWVDLGSFDTYEIAKREPFSLKLPVNGARTVRIRFLKDPSSKDIPFVNGVRVKALAAKVINR